MTGKHSSVGVVAEIPSDPICHTLRTGCTYIHTKQISLPYLHMKDLFNYHKSQSAQNRPHAFLIVLPSVPALARKYYYGN